MTLMVVITTYLLLTLRYLQSLYAWLRISVNMLYSSFYTNACLMGMVSPTIYTILCWWLLLMCMQLQVYTATNTCHGNYAYVMHYMHKNNIRYTFVVDRNKEHNTKYGYQTEIMFKLTDMSYMIVEYLWHQVSNKPRRRNQEKNIMNETFTFPWCTFINLIIIGYEILSSIVMKNFFIKKTYIGLLYWFILKFKTKQNILNVF